MPAGKSPINGQPIPMGIPFEKGNERAVNAGKRSGSRRRELRSIKDELLVLLGERVHSKDGKKMTVQTGIASAMIKRALGGDVSAFREIRDTIGQKPVERIEVQEPDFTELDAIR